MYSRCKIYISQAVTFLLRSLFVFLRFIYSIRWQFYTEVPFLWQKFHISNKRSQVHNKSVQEWQKENFVHYLLKTGKSFLSLHKCILGAKFTFHKQRLSCFGAFLSFWDLFIQLDDNSTLKCHFCDRNFIFLINGLRCTIRVSKNDKKKISSTSF